MSIYILIFGIFANITNYRFDITMYLLKRFICALALFIVFNSNAQVVVDLQSDVTKGCAPLKVTFENATQTVQNVEYIWDFGTGAPPAQSNEKERQIVYEAPGNYLIVLKAIDEDNKQYIDSIHLSVFAVPQADFSYTVGSCAPSNVLFENTSVEGDAPVTEVKWNFGGTNIFGETTTHNYIYAHTYEPYMHVSDANGCESSITKLVTVYEKPNSDFTLDNYFACEPPLQIKASNTQLQNDEYVYSWDFGNGETDNTYSPSSVNYTSKGDFVISQTVTVGETCSSTSGVVLSVGISPTPFKVYNGSLANEVTDLNNIPAGWLLFKKSENKPLVFEWIINGQTYTDEIAQALFCSPGTYDIELITGADLPCPESYKSTITIVENKGNIVTSQNSVEFESEVCTGDIMFESPYIGAYSTWNINGEIKNGGVTTYKICEPGDYTVNLIADYSGQCTFNLQKTFTVNECLPDVTFTVEGTTYEGEKPEICRGNITYDLTESIQGYPTWEIEDQIFYSISPTKHICFYGDTSVLVSGTTQYGCPFNIEKEYTLTKCYPDSFTLYDSLNNKVVYAGDTLCYQNQYYAVPDADVNFKKWKMPWDTLEVSPGFYAIKDTTHVVMSSINDDGCYDTTKYDFYLQDYKLDFYIDTVTYGCLLPIEINIVNQTPNGTEWEWHVDGSYEGIQLIDSTYSTDEHPVPFYFDGETIEQDSLRHYKEEMTFLVTLTSISDRGCKVDDAIQIKKEQPLANFLPEIPYACVNEDIEFESRDEADFNIEDSIHVYDVNGNYSYSYMREYYNDITDIYWYWGDGTSTHFEYDDLKTYVTDVEGCYKSVTSLDTDEENVINNFMAQHPGWGAYYHIKDWYFNNKIGSYPDFMECVKEKKALSNRMVKHAYTSPGEYNVTQVVVDANSCTDTAYYVGIRIGEPDPTLDFTFSDISVCPGDSLEVTTLYSNPGIDSWHFYSEELQLNTSCGTDDPTQKLAVSPLHTGSASIRLRAYHNGCMTEVVKDNIIEVKGPIAHFNFETICSSPFEYTFNDSLQAADTWLWDFGDGNSEANTNLPTHTYDTTGNFVVSLTAQNATSGCNDYIYADTVRVRHVHANAEYKSNFCPYSEPTITPVSVDYDTTGLFEPFIWFVNDVAVMRSWDMDFDVPSTFYGFSSDSIEVTLVAIDENRCEDTVRFKMVPKIPDIEIGISKDVLCGTHDTASFFIADRDSTVVSWKWNIAGFEFNDDTTDIDTIKRDFYFSNDISYVISVYGTDDNNCPASGYKMLKGYYKEANFEIENYAVCWTVDESKFKVVNPEIDSSFWDFGDGLDTIVTSNNVSHAYADEGKYNTKHISYYHGCTDTVIKYDSIVVQQVFADFTTETPVVCWNDNMQLKVTTPPQYGTGTWQIQGYSPIEYSDSILNHSFSSAGNKNVSLTLQVGTCTDTKSMNVVVNGANFSINDNAICKGDSILFTNSYTGIADSLRWEFGDGDGITITNNSTYHTYDSRGDFDVRLISYTEGCYDTITKKKIVNVEHVDANYWLTDTSVCKGDEVAFYHNNILDATYGAWQFNEYNVTPYILYDTMYIPYTKIGTFPTSLSVGSPNGCKDTVEIELYVNGASGDFHFDPEVACKNEQIQFVIDELVNVEKFTWFFGDGDTTSVYDPQHVYKMVGQIPVILEFEDSVGCVTYKSKPISITNVVAAFDILDTTLCYNEKIEVENVSENAITYEWNFGDELSIRDTEVTQYTFSKSGTFDVSLNIESNDHCFDTITKQVYIYPLPEVEFNAKDSICIGEDIIVHAVHDTLEQFTWIVDMSPFDQNVDSILFEPTETSIVAIHAIDTNQCENTNYHTIYVEQHPNHIVEPYDTLVGIGDTVRPRVSSNIPSTYVWETQSDGINCLDCQSPKIYSFDSHVYTVTITDWCFEESYDIFVNVAPTTKIGVPEAFSPNGDGENDILYVRGWGVKDLIDFRVYNRWGQEVFYSSEMQLGWDGTFKGEQQPTDTYAFTAHALTFLGETLEIKGYVTLIR